MIITLYVDDCVLLLFQYNNHLPNLLPTYQQQLKKSFQIEIIDRTMYE